MAAPPDPARAAQSVERFHRALTDLRYALARELIKRGIAFIDEQGTLTVRADG